MQNVDCDFHPALTSANQLLPYFDSYWRHMVSMRGIDRLDLQSFPAIGPLSIDASVRRSDGSGASDINADRIQAFLDPDTVSVICSPLFGGQAASNPHFSAALCKAANEWLAQEWLKGDERFRGSLLVPFNNVSAAVEEIEARSGDQRFVQVLMLAGADMPLGRAEYWPIYEAAQRYEFTVGLHAGTVHRHAPTPSGWPSHRAEDYVAIPNLFEAQVLSLMSEGVFKRFPQLRICLLESGASWLPSFIWRVSKLWRGLRIETPWLDKAPVDLLRSNFFVSTQPIDAPDFAGGLAALCEELGTEDIWLYASDYPHARLEGDGRLATLNKALRRKLLRENPLRAYPRLLSGATHD